MNSSFCAIMEKSQLSTCGPQEAKRASSNGRQSREKLNEKWPRIQKTCWSKGLGLLGSDNKKQQGEIRELKCLKYCCRGKIPIFHIQCKKLRVWNAVRGRGISQKGGPQTSTSGLALEEESRLPGAWENLLPSMGLTQSGHSALTGAETFPVRGQGDLYHGWEMRPLVLLFCISLCKMRAVHSGPLDYLKSVRDYEETGCFRSKGKEMYKHLKLICSLLNL